jgi:serine protease
MLARYIKILIATYCYPLLIGSSMVQSTEMPWYLESAGQNTWTLSAIQTAQIEPGPYRVVVAVIDSGILPNHPSLAEKVLPGYDMLLETRNLRGSRSADTRPDSRNAKCGNSWFTSSQRTHGTEVASIIAGNGSVVGVNPEARVLPVRTMGACGLNRSDLLDAIAWAAGLPVNGVPLNPHPARIINLSLTGGGATCDSKLQNLINEVTKRKVFVVAAAGNNFHKSLQEPANCEGVISVGALDGGNSIANYSALDSRTTIYAPGGTEGRNGNLPAQKLRVATFDMDIWGNEIAKSSEKGVGTSFAAALVSGFLSLWLSHQPETIPEDFFAKLPEFVRDVNHIKECPQCLPKGLAANSHFFTK